MRATRESSYPALPRKTQHFSLFFTILVLHHEPWTSFKLCVIIFLSNIVVTAGFSFEKAAKLWGFHQNPSVGSRVMLDWTVSMLHLCPAQRWCKSATGAKTITRWGTLSGQLVALLVRSTLLRRPVQLALRASWGVTGLWAPRCFKAVFEWGLVDEFANPHLDSTLFSV